MPNQTMPNQTMPNQTRTTATIETPKRASFKTSKLRGEWVELRFMTRAAELGLMLSKPWGDSAPYDLALERNGGFLRVQVKSTAHQRGRSFKCNISANHGPYLPGQLDFIAAYVIPADTWYILPAHAAAGQIHVMLSPHLATAKYSPYREAWHLLLWISSCSHLDQSSQHQPYPLRCHPDRSRSSRRR